MFETFYVKCTVGIGKFHSIFSHSTTLGGQLYQYYRFVPCGSEPISLNCICAIKQIAIVIQLAQYVHYAH